MVDAINRLKSIHLELIDWLKTKDNVPNIERYLVYVKDKLELYDLYIETGDLRALKGLTRNLNRYRDEFNFTPESVEICHSFFDKIDEIVIHIESTLPS